MRSPKRTSGLCRFLKAAFLVLMLGLATAGPALAQPTDQSPEAFVTYYLKAWAQGDYQATYSSLSKELRGLMTFEQHAKSMAGSKKADLEKARVLRVEDGRGPKGPDPARKVVYVEIAGHESPFVVIMEDGHWKLFGP